ncbi:MAG: lysostaphin resistance A-like protein [Candidatus Thorarchaeota archaeon]
MTTTETMTRILEAEENNDIGTKPNLLALSFVMLLIGVVWRIVDVMILQLGNTWMNILPSKLGPLLIILAVFWTQRETILGLSKDNIRSHLVIGIVMGVSFYLVVDVGGPALYAIFLNPSYPLDLTILNPELLAYAFVFFFINAVYEETLFRGVMQNGFRTKFSPSQAILLSSIIFGVWHAVWPIANGAPLIEGVVMVLVSAVIGGFFGVYYEKFASRRSLIGPIAAHTLINFLREDFKIGPWDYPQGPDMVVPEAAMMPIMLVLFFAIFGVFFYFAFKYNIENIENLRSRLSSLTSVLRFKDNKSGDNN